MEITPPASFTFEPRPVSGWVLRSLCDLDASSPHTLAHVLTASMVKRQAVFAAMAEMGRDIQHVAAALARATGIECRDPLAQIARALKPQHVIEAVYGSVPDGLLGALRRIGSEPFSRPGLYADLFRLFAMPADQRRADLVRQTSGKVTEERLEIALALDAALLHRRVFEGLAELADVERLNAAIALIRSTVSTATVGDLRRSLAELPKDADLESWAVSWLRKTDRPLAALPSLDDPDLIILGVADLAAAARKFRNCLHRRVLHVASGRNCYVVATTEPGAVAELRRTANGGWVIEDVFGPVNEAPDPHVAAEMRRKLESAGVVSLASVVSRGDLERLAHVFNAFDLVNDWPPGRRLQQRLQEIEEAA